MSPLVWTLIDCEKLINFQKKIQTFCYKLSVLVFYQKQAATKLDNSFQPAVCYFFFFFFFLWTGTTLAFFHSMGNFLLSMHDLKISSKGLQIESQQILNMRILVVSKLWALFGLRFFNDISRVIFSKWDSWKKVICSLKGINQDFASIFN